MKNNLILSSSPHLYAKESTKKIMWVVVLSLIPAGCAGVIIFGFQALWIIFLGVTSALATEAILQLISKRTVTIADGSAFITGLLLAYNLPPRAPFWLPVLGSFFSIAIAKHLFGGLGQNIFNPALVGRVFLMASWPKYMTAFTQPISTQALKVDSITAATPLTLLKEGKLTQQFSYLDLFCGKHAGSIGEVSIFALLLGALLLLIMGYISWHIPISYIFSLGLLCFIFGPRGLFTGNWLFHLLSGGLILGAFFMATDYVTSPLTRKGQIIFGVGCGLITAIIRLKGGYPEGVSYAILIMNAFVPLIDRYIRPRIYGT